MSEHTPDSRLPTPDFAPLPLGDKLLAYAQLFRLPNVFTALADVAMGYLFTHDPDVDPMWGLAGLLVASAALYIAGMTLNDVFDVEIDRVERPGRPLPSGRIAVKWARQIGFGLLLLGVVIGVGLSAWSRDWRPGGVAVGLAAMILLYDGGLKKTPLGPVAMGSCRLLNVLLGMSLSPAPWTGLNLLVAAGIGVYIVGVTWFARNEAEPESHRGQLTLALLVMLGGMALLWRVEGQIDPRQLNALLQQDPERWTLFWLALGALAALRCLRAIVQPHSEFVQEAVKQSLFSLILLDAVLTFATRDLIWAVAVLALILPMTLLGRWVYST